jgi:archaeosine synthase
LYYTGEDLKWVKHIKDTDDLWCSCDSCRKLISSGSISHPGSGLAVKNVDNKLIALHNLECGINEIKKIRKKIETGTLRAYLEKKCSDSTFLISSLRYIDSIDPNPIAAVQRLNKKSKLLCVDSLSYKEPQVVRFKNRVGTNYFPDPNTKLCVLLPCSMRKPYSKSKSHRKFIKTIKSAAGKDYGRISQIIITSPLGLVPRELEEVYPAVHYDISVTGTWDAEEIQLTAQSIALFIQKLPQKVPIIARLSEGYLAAFEMAQKIVNNERPYFIAADLDELKEIIISQLDLINSNGDNLTDNKKNHDLLSNEEQLIRSIADFQFGPGSGKKLIGTTARFIYSRNERFREIHGFESYGKISLGKFSRDNGQIKLNLNGGERLASNSNNILVLKADITGSTIFRPAVGKLDENLVSGDEVIILDSSENYFGVGQMVVNAKTALKLRRGAVVKIRKKKKKQQL